MCGRGTSVATRHPCSESKIPGHGPRRVIRSALSVLRRLIATGRGRNASAIRPRRGRVDQYLKGRHEVPPKLTEILQRRRLLPVPTFTGSSACDRELVKACVGSQGIPLLNITAGWIYTLNVGRVLYRPRRSVRRRQGQGLSTWMCCRQHFSFPLGEIRRVHHASDGDRTARS